MKKIWLVGAIGFVAGAGVALALLFTLASTVAFSEDVSPHSFDETVDRILKSAEREGWKVPKVHDLKASVASAGRDVLPAKVIELCKPEHAGRILADDDARLVSSLMPCRLSVYERSDGTVVISRMNSPLMAGLIGGLVKEVMTQAAADNERIIAGAIK